MSAQVAVKIETGSNGRMVLIEPELRAGLTRRVFSYMPTGHLEWASLNDWRENGERARFFGFASKDLPASMTENA